MVKTKGSLTEEQMIAIENYEQVDDVATDTTDAAATSTSEDTGPINWDAPGEGERA